MEEKKTNSKSHPVICPKCKYNRPVALSYCPHCRAEAQKQAQETKNDVLNSKLLKDHVFKASTKREDTEQKKQQTANGEKANKLKRLPKAGGKPTSRAKSAGKPVRNKRANKG